MHWTAMNENVIWLANFIQSLWPLAAIIVVPVLVARLSARNPQRLVIFREQLEKVLMPMLDLLGANEDASRPEVARMIMRKVQRLTAVNKLLVSSVVKARLETLCGLLENDDLRSSDKKYRNYTANTGIA